MVFTEAHEANMQGLVLLRNGFGSMEQIVEEVHERDRS